MRLVASAGVFGLTGACVALLGIPDLGDPANVAKMTAQFKAIIQAEHRGQAPLDWGVADGQIWRHYMGPHVLAFCGRPLNVPAMQRPYQINFFQGSFGNIGELAVNTPAEPADSTFCGTHPGSS